MRPFLIAIFFLSLVLQSFAQQIPERFPVGDEPFLKREGMRIVRNVAVFLQLIWDPPDPNGLGRSINVGFAQTYPHDPKFNTIDVPINTKGDWTEDQLLALAKESARDYLYFPKTFEAYHTADYTYCLGVVWINWDYAGYKAVPFAYSASFHLEQGPDGIWYPPKWAIESIQFNSHIGLTNLVSPLKYQQNAFLRFSGLQWARIRWLEASYRFADLRYPEILPLPQSLPIQRKPMEPTGISFNGNSLPETESVFVDPTTGILVVPTEPIIGKRPGIISLGFWEPNKGEVVARYALGTGLRVPELQGRTEPIILALQKGNGGIAILASADKEDSTIVFERSNDLRNWREIISGKDGARNFFGMGVAPDKGGLEFFRARYMQ